MTVLVTGATGFLARYVIPAIQRRGHPVIATAIENTEDAAKCPWLAGVRYHAYDLAQRDTSNFALLEKPDTLLHLAWQGLPHYTEMYHIERNLWTSYLFIKEMIAGGLRDLTVAGTCFEYGMREGCLDESMDPRPANAYAVAKDSLRRFADMLHLHADFTFRWLRLFYLYGAGQAPSALMAQLQAALDRGEKSFNMSGGEQVRDYLPAAVMGEHIAACALQTRHNGVINCCSGAPITVRALVERYLAERNVQIALNLGYYPYPNYEPMAFWGDATRLRAVLSQVEGKHDG
jgi:dTDP-6-deoxy-L-talose 4-dehydrogenase (NAD+)